MQIKILAIAGSIRSQSTNSALLQVLANYAPSNVTITLYDGLGQLPMFSPDLEGRHTPSSVNHFCGLVDRADGMILSSPEYARTIPGGLKNAIDWLVSRNEIIDKPISLVHASHRGDDMLHTLRLVLATVSTRFNESAFLRVPLMTKTPNEVQEILREPANKERLEKYLEQFCADIGAS